MMNSTRASATGLLAMLALVFALPVILMLLTSFKSVGQIEDGSLFTLPHPPTLAAWSKAWGAGCLGNNCHGISKGIANSFAIVLPALVMSLCLGAISGFALSARPSRYAEVLFVMLLTGLFVPPQVTLYPMILSLRAAGLFGTRAGLILVHVVWGLPFLTLLFRNFFSSLPRTLWNTARIDGIGFWGMLGCVMAPMSWPICIVALVLQFTYLWNDFLLGLTFAGPGREPVTITLNILAGPHLGPQEYNAIMASATLTAAPTILLYLLSSSRIVSGHVWRQPHG